ncbi:hypothetical protein JL100_024195 [Skermanella mucosa]|uniref:hypothetical protein n=1 Tax=Skermanella mucosa TaxID=1789672 RepID=UPI00192C47A0|nr:hypothetical protein [Skermanella mucosa]UEM20145.1 hypothetical protein JL100_024195 [Skermanella mucosa]
MVGRMRAGGVVDKKVTAARKGDGMGTRPTEGQAQPEKRLSEDIAEAGSEPKADTTAATGNTPSLNRKLNILLARMGLS